MKNFVRVWQIETSIESIDDGQEPWARAFEGTDEHDDYVAVRVQVKSMIDTVDNLARTLQLFAYTQHDFNRQELDELVDQIKRREEDQIPNELEEKDS